VIDLPDRSQKYFGISLRMYRALEVFTWCTISINLSLTYLPIILQRVQGNCHWQKNRRLMLSMAAKTGISLQTFSVGIWLLRSAMLWDTTVVLAQPLNLECTRCGRTHLYLEDDGQDNSRDLNDEQHSQQHGALDRQTDPQTGVNSWRRWNCYSSCNLRGADVYVIPHPSVRRHAMNY